MVAENGKLSASKSDWDKHYASGMTPWDTQITPPEVALFWQHHEIQPNALAVDLGCGTGTNLCFLHSLGMRVIGIDLSGIALLRAAQKLRCRGTEWSLFQADVCLLPFQNVQAAYILDIGCLHAIPPSLRPAYAEGVIENLGPGGYYHLFAFDRYTATGEGNPNRGVLPREVETLFAPHLAITSVIYGRPSRSTCRWYLLRREQTDL